MSSSATTNHAARWIIAALGVTTLLGAFLLFEVQPLVSKAILPWFGGAPAVWTTCMLFFQLLLLGGYLYAHLLGRWLSARNQALVHLAVVIVAALALPILPGAAWRPPAGSNPTWRILWLLGGTVGLPYFALSATSPLVQSWFGGSLPGRSPYRLYALSNFGSLVALLSYPLVIEPALDLPRQSAMWTAGFLLYGLFCAAALACVWRAAAGSGRPDGATTDAGAAMAAPTAGQRVIWLALPALASLMLLATTNHVCQDVAVVPLLWVVPLALYLLSFIICFDHARWYVRPVWATLAVLALLGAVLTDGLNALSDKRFHLGLIPQLAIYFSALFCACMVCHGELARRKPDPRRLTEFYLLIAAGGALGGALVAVVAPLLFSMYLEWYVGVAASVVLSFGMLTVRGARRRNWLVRDLCYGAFAFVAAIGLGYAVLWPDWLASPSAPALPACLERTRNFFGIVSVTQESLSDAAADGYRLLVNGNIQHGSQFTDPARRRQPTSYYGEPSGVGRAIRYLQRAGPIRIGAIGLGTGTLAAYARPGDTLVFYEINPQVVRLARQYFTYLSDCRGKLDLVLGDARLSLENEGAGARGSETEPDGKPPRPFDLLVVDAFSGDAIPAHLVTREALRLYRRHLARDGVVAFHVSNTYLRLAPVVRRLAADCGMLATRIDHDPTAAEKGNLLASCTWVLLTRSEAFVRAVPSDPPVWPDDGPSVPLWTDQYSNLFRILKGR